MIMEMLEKLSDLSTSFQRVSEDIILLRFKIVNAAIIGNPTNQIKP